MSSYKNISLWKKKSEIDYIPLFISLWFSLNSWIKNKYIGKNDREMLEILKNDKSQLNDQFQELINGNSNAKSMTFKGYFLELHQALQNANLEYERLPKTLQDTLDKKISFNNVFLEWRDDTDPSLESIVKKKSQHDRLEISPSFHIDNNTSNVFRAYIEILYQIRCLLFHGMFTPKYENERVIKALYLTLSMVMDGV